MVEFNELITVQALDLYNAVIDELSLVAPDLAQVRRRRMARDLVLRVFRDHGSDYPLCKCGHSDTEHNRATARCLECDCEMFMEAPDA